MVVWYIHRHIFAIQNEWRKFQVKIFIRSRVIEVIRSALSVLFLEQTDISLRFRGIIINVVSKCAYAPGDPITLNRPSLFFKTRKLLWYKLYIFKHKPCRHFDRKWTFFSSKRLVIWYFTCLCSLSSLQW